MEISHFNPRWDILTLIALITNNISMVSGCQSPSQSPAVVLDMRTVYCGPQNPRQSTLAKLSTRKKTILPLYFYLPACAPWGMLSRVTSITGLSAQNGRKHLSRHRHLSQLEVTYPQKTSPEVILLETLGFCFTCRVSVDDDP